MNHFAEMNTFVEVIEAGSLSAAAKRMGIAVSAVSRRISELETRLGVRLANRSTRGFSATPLGQTYYERCILLLAELKNTEALISRDVGALHGRSHFSIPQEFGMRFISPILFKFSKSHPNAVLDVDFNDRTADLVVEGLDFAIRIGQQDETNVSSINIGKISYSLAATPSFWKQHGKPIVPNDIKGLPILAYRAGMPSGKLYYESKNVKRNYVQLSPRILSNNGVYLIKAAVAGLGICLEPSFMLESAVHDNKLECVLTDYTWIQRDIYIVYPKGRPLPILAQRLIEQVLVALGESPTF